MGLFEAARQIDFLAKRYQITTDEVQQFDAMLQRKGLTWDDFTMEEVQMVIIASRNKSTTTDADRAKAESVAAKRRADELEKVKREKEAKEKQAAEELAAKSKAQQAAKEKAQFDADMRLLAWQQRQASNGSASAEYSLGIRYATGKGVQTNYQLAVYWLSLSAAQDNSEARRALQRLTNGLPVTSGPTGVR